MSESDDFFAQREAQKAQELAAAHKLHHENATKEAVIRDAERAESRYQESLRRRERQTYSSGPSGNPLGLFLILGSAAVVVVGSWGVARVFDPIFRFVNSFIGSPLSDVGIEYLHIVLGVGLANTLALVVAKLKGTETGKVRIVASLAGSAAATYFMSSYIDNFELLLREPNALTHLVVTDWQLGAMNVALGFVGGCAINSLTSIAIAIPEAGIENVHTTNCRLKAMWTRIKENDTDFGYRLKRIAKFFNE
jgi:hypothetical protein